MVETVYLEVDSIIGTGDPADKIMLLPLIYDWHVPNQCIFNISEPCEEMISRLYRLRNPVQDHTTVGVCEKHHQKIWAGGTHCE